jgi:hypothetical protein
MLLRVRDRGEKISAAPCAFAVVCNCYLYVCVLLMIAAVADCLAAALLFFM